LGKFSEQFLSRLAVFWERLPENIIRGKTMSHPMEWTPEAEARLKEIPFFVRPAARKKIEAFAQAAGLTQITADVYEQAKKQFG
jgi:Proto-chlorophyllide reductase 57 kD subunit